MRMTESLSDGASADAVTDVAEGDRADGSHEEAGSEDAPCGEQGREAAAFEKQ